MGTVSFAFLAQAFDITDQGVTTYSSTEDSSATNFGAVSSGGDEIDYFGAGFGYAGGVATSGTVNTVEVDLGNDDATGSTDIRITGLSIAASAFAFNSGSSTVQNERIWRTILAGADAITFNLGNFSAVVTFAGDGANISDLGLHVGSNDSLLNGGDSLASSSGVFGDYVELVSGTSIGGNDTITVGARAVAGDFSIVHSGAGSVGGDDQIVISKLSANSDLGNLTYGDAQTVAGSLFGGNDLIDFRATDLTGFASTIVIGGDVGAVASTGALVAGNDTIHGSALADQIAGDYFSNSGFVEGGKDRLFGYGGNDTISGNEGRDQLFGGDGDDSLNGGLDGDIIDGGIGNDNMTGDTGNDIMTGGDGNDTMIAGSGSDTVDGGIGDDAADAGAGADVMIGGTGKDGLFGGTGNDSISGDAGNDTLQGGDGADTMLGGAGFDLLLGGNDNDFLDGGASNDNLFGNAGVDTFNFAIGGGTDTIRDMVAGVGLNDVIRLEGFGTAFDTFAEVMAAATDNGTDTTINFGGGNVLIIQNVTVAQFNTDDFIFG